MKNGHLNCKEVLYSMKIDDEKYQMEKSGILHVIAEETYSWYCCIYHYGKVNEK